MVLLLPPMDVPLVLEIERVSALEAAGSIDAAEATRLLDRAHDALDAALERREAPRTRFDCSACGGVGSRPTHRLDCVYYRRPR
jgi:hypothetical protein